MEETRRNLSLNRYIRHFSIHRKMRYYLYRGNYIFVPTSLNSRLRLSPHKHSQVMKQFREALFGIFAKRELESRRRRISSLSPSLFPPHIARAREDNFKYSRKISFRHFAPIKSRIPRAGVERGLKKERAGEKSREREREKSPRDLNLPQIRTKRAQRQSRRKWRLRIPSPSLPPFSAPPISRAQRKYIYKIHARRVRARPG